MHKLEDLKIWNKAMNIAEKTYLLSANFPSEERFGITRQISRSAISVASNIAEGTGRNTKGEFYNFLGVAHGSSYELFTQLILPYRLNLVDEDVVKPLLEEV